MEEKLHSQDRQEISKSMKTSEETKLSWTTTWFLAGKICCCSIILDSLSAETMIQESVRQPFLILFIFHSLSSEEHFIKTRVLPLHGVKPIIDGYQNKSTFSVNQGPDGNPKTEGYYLRTWRGTSSVYSLSI
uniref:tRNA methyltransferase 2-like protein B n=1 Tax=Rousettus aegyptiacus TaxID=9407 RepID=A0A7J8EM97_ROUAE|nr:tRNA methyltransferase 2-like protein B [Rousettus aegyptiacus]